MTIVDWLATDGGRTFLVALVGLMHAVSYYLWYLSHRDREGMRKLLNGHLAAHMAAESNHGGLPNDKPG